ncbi:MAG: polymer-forming cytoskeletal protein [Anaerolineae bacterium]|nr:polymer-forming cytoskeletal protein [Anaerolineae bacterium]
MKRKFLTKTITLILPLLLALVSLFALTPPALAQGPNGDQVIFGENLELKAEEKINGDVLVFGGNVTIPKGSEINGDMVVFGGNAHIDGTVAGDIGMLGGNVILGKTALVKGDIGLVGGNADVAEGATVEGQVQTLNRFVFGEGEGFTVPPIPPISPVPPIPPVPPVAPLPTISPDHVSSGLLGGASKMLGFFKSLVEDIAILVALAVIAWLVSAFMPEQMKVVGDTMTQSAPLSFSLGLVTWVVAAVIGGVLAITICLAFIPLLGFILLAIATLFGWIVAGQIIGERLLVASGRPYPNLVSSTVIGVTALTIVATMPLIGEVPCIGFIFGLVGTLVGLVVSLTGLGAVILTRFGTQPYPPQAYAYAGGVAPAPRPAPAPADILSSLERSEAELRARIDAALAEADAADKEAPAEEEPTGGEAEEDAGSEEGPSGEQPPKKPRKPKTQAPDAGDEPEQNPTL